MIFDLEQFYKQKENKIIEILVKKWEKIDYFLFKNKRKKYKVVKIKERKLITKFGVIKYKRRIYYYYNKKNNKIEYISLLDRYLKIPKYKRFSWDVINHVAKFLGDGKRYRDIKDTLRNVNISLMSISNIFKNHIFGDNEIKKIKLQNNQNLYINIDDCFVTSKIDKIGNTCKIRPVSFSTGINKNNNRKFLENKRISFEIKKSNEINKSYYLNRKNSKSWIYNEMNKYYENWENANLILCGDGANWITTIGKNINATQVLSKFHVIQHARNSFLIINNNTYKYIDYVSYKNFWKAINTFDLNLALETLEIYCAKLKTKKQFPGKLRKTRIFIKYIKNNWLSFANYSESWNIGVSAESDVFHLVKQAVNGRTYNFQTLTNILTARADAVNGRI